MSVTSSQAPSYASPKLLPTHSLTDSLTGVKCKATSVAKNWDIKMLVLVFLISPHNWSYLVKSLLVYLKYMFLKTIFFWTLYSFISVKIFDSIQKELHQ